MTTKPEIDALVGLAKDKKPNEFYNGINDALLNRISDIIAGKREEVARQMFSLSTPEAPKDGDGINSDEDNQETPETEEDDGEEAERDPEGDEVVDDGTGKDGK